MQRQLYQPKDAGSHNTDLIGNLGLEHPNGLIYQRGRDWSRQQVCRHEDFSLVVAESFSADAETIGYTKQQDYIKVNFWLSGKHTTILDGFGQHEHDRPEVFITSGPPEMVKVDVLNRASQTAVVALCVRREFFSTHLGMMPEDLPEPLRTIVVPDEKPYTFCRFPLTADLSAAARAILVAPFTLRANSIYGRAKSVELMCLLIDLMATHGRWHGGGAIGKHEFRLHNARELITRRFAEPMTLEQIAKEVGLNRLALTSGFRQLFGMSVHDYLQRRRMERAYELLQEEEISVARVAEVVGFSHNCNFSTAFRAYFGCPPRAIRCRGTKKMSITKM